MRERHLRPSHSHQSNIYQGSFFLILACFFAVFATKVADFHDKSLSLFQMIEGDKFGLLILVSPLAFVLASWMTHRTYSTHVTEAVVKTDEPQTFSWKGMETLKRGLIEAVASMIAISGGASIGREVPSIIVGISFFDQINTKLRKKRKSAEVFSHRTAGAACGIAACFESPLVGIAFATEAFGNRFLKGLRHFAVLTIIMAGVVSQLMPIGIGLKTLALRPTLDAQAILSALLVGAISGIFSWLFIFATFVFKGFLPKSKMAKVFVLPAVCGLAVAILSVTLNQSPGPGFDLVNASSHGTAVVDHGALFLGRFMSALFTVAAGFNAWIMTPSMGIGYGLGAWIAEFLEYREVVYCGIIGMGSYLAGVARAPLTAVLIVSLFAQDSRVVLPLLLACGLSYFICRDCSMIAQRFIDHVEARRSSVR